MIHTGEYRACGRLVCLPGGAAQGISRVGRMPLDLRTTLGDFVSQACLDAGLGDNNGRWPEDVNVRVTVEVIHDKDV